MKSSRLDGLDALRGIAAVCVLIYHAAGENSSNAYLAVDFFFMLSGYVMARSYEGRLGAEMGAGRFVALRLSKLWPTMFLASLIGLPWLLSKFEGEHAALIAVANLFLIPTLAYNRVYVLNGPAWSILFELLANAIHGALLWRLSSRAIALALIPLSVLLILFASQFTMEMGSTPSTFIGGVPRVFLSYSIGIILYRTFKDRANFRLSRRFTYLSMPIFFMIGATTDGQSWIIDLIFIIIICPIIIVGGLQIEKTPPLLKFLGTISFPLYAIHVPVIGLGEVVGMNAWWAVPVTFPTAFALGKIVERCVKPTGGRLRWRLARN